MSYCATINFKTLKECELYDFLTQIKNSCSSKLKEIAEKEFIYMPSIKNDYLLNNDSEYAKEQIDRAWMRNSVFSYRFFYIPQHNLLGVFGVPSAIDNIFDLNCCFQNSSDQDYDFNEWNGIPVFEQIVEKWKNSSDHDVYKTFEYILSDWEPIDYDYWRRSNAYNEIWQMIEPYFYNEDKVVYISMFGSYEVAEQKIFCKLCRNAYDEWYKKNISNYND